MNPLNIKNGRVSGVYKLKDETGFPISASYEEAQQRGLSVDWIEALADAARQDVIKFDALMSEIELLVPDEVETIRRMFFLFLLGCKGQTFEDKSTSLYGALSGEDDAFMTGEPTPPNLTGFASGAHQSGMGYGSGFGSSGSRQTGYGRCVRFEPKLKTKTET